MGIAEEELKQAGPEADGAFGLLSPPHILRAKTLDLYRAHARELITRFKADEDTRPGTDAECLAALLEGSLRAPLDSTGGFLADTLFRRVFSAKDVERLGLGEAPREPYTGAANELLGDLRRKLRVEGRRA